jgi:hypothetical protein
VLAASIIALMMDAAGTFEVSENFYQFTRRNNQKIDIFNLAAVRN